MHNRPLARRWPVVSAQKQLQVKVLRSDRASSCTRLAASSCSRLNTCWGERWNAIRRLNSPAPACHQPDVDQARRARQTVSNASHMKVAGTPPGPAKYQGNGLARSLAVRLCIALMGCSALGSELPQPTQSSPSVSQGHKILFCGPS